MSIRKKPWDFCETPEEKCTLNYCDENGCQNRKREKANPLHLAESKIRKGDRLRCLIDYKGQNGLIQFTQGRVYDLLDDLRIRSNGGHLYAFKENYIRTLFEKAKTSDAINPDHYKSYSVETIDMMIAIYGKEKVAIHCELTAFKYRMGMGKKKSETEDHVDGQFINCFKKEKWYLDKAKELREETLNGNS